MTGCFDDYVDDHRDEYLPSRANTGGQRCAHECALQTTTNARRAFQELGPVPISRFAEAIEISRSSATLLVDRLEVNGLVERVVDKADRRMTRIHITQRGLKALKDCRLLSSSIIGRHIEALSPEQQHELANLLELVACVNPVTPPTE